MSTDSDKFDKILECVRALQKYFPANFILTVIDSLKFVEGFEVMAGELSYRSVIIDLLTTINDRFAYNQVDGHIRYVHGVRLLQPDFALAVKIRCFYLRQDGFQKLLDVGFERLLIPWKENTPKQRAYYSEFAAEETDPLTVPLDEDLYEE
ncbi:hypothetical protein BBP40_001991 [Aspergillus hancockii]|nr:hypothetical protein BBP40_001991 [Aspergillus hancockii]